MCISFLSYSNRCRFHSLVMTNTIKMSIQRLSIPCFYSLQSTSFLLSSYTTFLTHHVHNRRPSPHPQQPLSLNITPHRCCHPISHLHHLSPSRRCSTRNMHLDAHPGQEPTHHGRIPQKPLPRSSIQGKSDRTFARGRGWRWQGCHFHFGRYIQPVSLSLIAGDESGEQLGN